MIIIHHLFIRKPNDDSIETSNAKKSKSDEVSNPSEGETQKVEEKPSSVEGNLFIFYIT